MKVIVKEVKSPKEFNRFLKLPYKIFKDTPQWVPPFLMDEKDTFNPKKNPAFEFCECERWNAYDADTGEHVGRIAGIINHRSNEVWNEKKIRFGWVDFVDSQDVVDALFYTLEYWGKSKGLQDIHGPLGFCDMDREGMLVEGFDHLPTIVSIYNHEYYPKRLEKYGFKKEVDWVQYEGKASQPISESMARMSTIVQQKYNVKVLQIKSMKSFVKQYGKSFFELVNIAFKDLYGYVPLSEKQMDYYIKRYLPFLRKDLLCCITDEKDELIAFVVSMPSLSKALIKNRGKIFPFGWMHILKAIKRNESVDFYLTGVHPDWQNKGLPAVYYSEMNEKYISLQIKTAVANPQLEENQASWIWKRYGGELAMRRRAYGKPISVQ